MISARKILAMAALLSVALPVQAADLGDGYNQCQLATGSTLLSQTSNAALTEDVVKLMNEAVSVADDSQWINSRRPAFTWASEAKAACGKAYGYLQANYRDDDSINKCECFHTRMVQYMN
ncbi:hypothetical protein ASD64_14750 [Mesorhizobium sp. Root157]|uniref:hypothetical protein n=1 Tax=Mesorhizobium sp. Root157 TaxID=1736477 RepID=UPI0007006ACC|nr:hypothetical protein [Mesorhizobium sp. Root157]KQZ99586.1 hypothetical protein ASD64_14750 [Mesorhizobium sp. Root157]